MHLKFRLFIIVIYILLYGFKISAAQTGLSDSNFVYMEKGAFFMGCKHGDDDELPVKKIKLHAFYISKYEVTNKQYCSFLNEAKPEPDSVRKYIDFNPDRSKLKGKIFYDQGLYKVEQIYEEHPVNFVSWYGADAFCKFYGYRLPTEAEWEYAAKTGINGFKMILRKYYKYSGSNDPELVAWFGENSQNKVHRIGTKQPNKAGIFDLSGNVDEWCKDWYKQDYYSRSVKDNPQGPAKADFKVIRGGSWYNSEKMIKITNRRASNPKSQKATIGFRFVKDKDL